MKANLFQKYWIVIRSIWATLYISLKVLCLSWSGRLTRHKIDRIERKWSKKILRYVKSTYEIHNPHHVHLEPGKKYLLMSNHASHYDIPLIVLTLPGRSIRMIAKKELFRVPIWGSAMQKSDIISIDRNDRKQAIKDLERARQKMEEGIIPWIAPEGTRSRTGKLNPFKKGGFLLAQKTGATIIPVGICGSGKILPPKTLDFTLGVHVNIYIAKPIDSSQYKNADKHQLMQDVEASIRGVLEKNVC